ncbi:MAG: hypothetical protein FWH41_08440 [Treponema sp.]|nr:hypothetical protein [Treponema sp.]
MTTMEIYDVYEDKEDTREYKFNVVKSDGVEENFVYYKTDLVIESDWSDFSKNWKVKKVDRTLRPNMTVRQKALMKLLDICKKGRFHAPKEQIELFLELKTSQLTLKKLL